MNYGALVHLDIANGPGCRVNLFVSGCRNHCEGCFQPETWSFTYGREFDSDAMTELLTALEKPHIQGLSILGGDPFEPENRGPVLDICKAVRERFGDSKTIWIWTGYLWEDLRDEPVLNYIDVLVDGPFIKSERDLSLFYRGSRNQRVIDIPKTLERGCAIRYGGTQKWK